MSEEAANSKITSVSVSVVQSIYSRSLEYELITDDWSPNQSNCLKLNNHWTVFNKTRYPFGNIRNILFSFNPGREGGGGISG